MKSNRYRNTIRIPTVLACVAITAVTIFVALNRVASRNRVIALGDKQRQIEKDVRLLRQELTALDLRIESLLTRDKVQPRLAGARTMLRPITKDRLIELSP